VTVVERMRLSRVRTSGHAVDLFGPAMNVAEWTGVLPAVTAARTRTEIVSFQRSNGRGVDVGMRRLVAGISGRHVEIMRGELASILYDATRNDVRYLFEDSIQTLVEEPDRISVTFEHARPTRSTWSSGRTVCTQPSATWPSGPRTGTAGSSAATSQEPLCPTISASKAGWSCGTLRGGSRRSTQSTAPP
jgi:hypothetical protein